MAPRILIFHLQIPYQEWLAYHRGAAASVQVEAEDGRQIRLPASALRAFASHTGVYGRFALRYDDTNNRLLDLRRL